jgi:hypothetical protein
MVFLERKIFSFYCFFGGSVSSANLVLVKFILVGFVDRVGLGSVVATIVLKEKRDGILVLEVIARRIVV